MHDAFLDALIETSWYEPDGLFDVPCVIFHYTSPEGLLGILEPGGMAKFWFTRYDSLNDKNERRDIIESLEKYCERKVKCGELSRVFSDKILEIPLSDSEFLTYPGEFPTIAGMHGETDAWMRGTTIDCDTYLCCFSKYPDLLPMWNYYTKSRHYEGYSIGICSRRLRESCGQECGYFLDVKPVLYHDEEKNELFDNLLLPLNDRFLNGNEAERKDILTVISGKLNEFQFLFKNACFGHEHEIRAILRIPKDGALPYCRKFDVKHRTSNGYIVPYVEYEIPADVIVEVMVAPLMQKEISTKNVSEMLKQRGYENVYVDASKVPIRF